MSNSKVYHGITQAVFDCVRATSIKQHGTVYTPPNSNSGKTSTSGTGWTVDMTFNFDPGSGALSYTITHKTWIVPESAIWSGLDATINGCQQSNFAG